MTFDDFWIAYPRKVAKHAAQKAFAKLTPLEQHAALDALPAHCAEWARRGDIAFTPHAATWLRGKRWEDELQPATPIVGSAAYYARYFGEPQ